MLQKDRRTPAGRPIMRDEQRGRTKQGSVRRQHQRPRRASSEWFRRSPREKAVSSGGQGGLGARRVVCVHGRGPGVMGVESREQER